MNFSSRIGSQVFVFTRFHRVFIGFSTVFKLFVDSFEALGQKPAMFRQL